MELFLPDPEATEAYGAELAVQIPQNTIVFLHGELGAGKTALVRGFLRAAGHSGPVKSPTYNIVEEYTLPRGKLFHFDLYRLNDSEELEWMGIEDYFNQDALIFIEWPEKGEGVLPAPDIAITLVRQAEGRLLALRRNAQKK
jgi:tRNA threonylcarbamoyladenosine biosynthesis protein TsaE